MAKEINIQISDSNYRRIQEIVDIENSISKWAKNDWKEVSVEDFIKGCIYHRLDFLDNFDVVYQMAFQNGGQYKNNFKNIAEEMNIPQSQISAHTGINPSTLSLIFNNRQQPRMDFFFRIWICLKCPPLYKCLIQEKG